MALTNAGRDFIAQAIINDSPTFFTNANAHLGVGDLLNGFDRDFAQATGFTANSKVWQVSIEGYKYFYAKITAIAGGNETIVGGATI